MAQYEVTGTLSPDVTGVYSQAGNYNGLPYYRHTSGNWYLWYYLSPPATHVWNISEGLGTFLNAWNRTSSLSPVGVYSPFGGGGTTGNPVVSERVDDSSSSSSDLSSSSSFSSSSSNLSSSSPSSSSVSSSSSVGTDHPDQVVISGSFEAKVTLPEGFNLNVSIPKG